MAVRNDRRREEILKATYSLLCENDYSQVALSEIARLVTSSGLDAGEFTYREYLSSDSRPAIKRESVK
jgi:AcrR family transcriptional regulator